MADVQAGARLGGAVRKGERGTTVVYADRFIPKKESDSASGEDGTPRSVPFLKRFTVFNIAQCDGLPADVTRAPAPVSHVLPVEAADALIAATGANVHRGGEQAFYHPGDDYIRIPEQTSFFEPINFFRTALHELTHWSGAKHRLNRDFTGRYGSEAYSAKNWSPKWEARFSAPRSASFRPYAMPITSATGLTVLKSDSRAIVSAASHASKASDFLLAFTDPASRTA